MKVSKKIISHWLTRGLLPGVSFAFLPVASQAADTAAAIVNFREVTTLRGAWVDWDYGYGKGSCAAGESIVGLSSSAVDLQGRAGLCRRLGPAFSGTVAATLLVGGNRRRAKRIEDWAWGYQKLECGLQEYVSGVSEGVVATHGSNQFHALQCANGSGFDSDLRPTVRVYDAGNSIGFASAGDWDYTANKGQCSDGEYVVGVSVSSSTGAPHSILCQAAPGSISALVQQLAPVVHLSTEENYYPSSVESFFSNTELRNGHYVTKQPLGCDSCTDPAFLRGSRPDAASIPVYAMVVPKADGITTDFVYWMFYPYNNGKRVCIGAYVPGVGCIGGYSTFGNHVGDWEHVTIRLVNRVPTQIALSQHDNGETLNWGDPRVQMRGTHPVFYAATGSHGLYPDARRHTYKFLPNGDTLNDDTSAGVAWNTWNNLVEIRRLPLGHYAGNLSWLNFEGRWGNPKAGCNFSAAVSGECVLNDGPTGPMLKPVSDPGHQLID